MQASTHAAIILSPSGGLGVGGSGGGGGGGGGDVIEVLSSSESDVEPERRADTIKRAPPGFYVSGCRNSDLCDSAGEVGANLTSGPEADLEDNQDYDSDLLSLDCLDPDKESPLPSDPETLRRVRICDLLIAMLRSLSFALYTICD